MRAVLRACQSEGVECILHERGCNKNHYELFKNHLPHDITAINEAINKLWNDNAPIAGRSLVPRPSQPSQPSRNVVEVVRDRKEKGALPEGFDPQQKNVAIFCSSDDEFVTIGDGWRNDLYPNQVTAIELLTSDLKPGEKTGAYQYGFWFQTRGFLYRYYTAETLFEGKFKGNLVYPKPKPSLMKKFKQQIREALKINQ